MDVPGIARTGHSAFCLPYNHKNDNKDEVYVFGGGDNDGAYFKDLGGLMIDTDKKKSAHILMDSN